MPSASWSDVPSDVDPASNGVPGVRSLYHPIHGVDPGVTVLAGIIADFTGHSAVE